MRKAIYIAVAAATWGLPCVLATAETLPETVGKTIATSPDLLIRTNDRLAVDQELRQAKAGYLPSIDASAGIGRERSDNPTTRAGGLDAISLTRQELGIKLDQLLWDGGGTPGEVDRQTKRVNARAYGVQATADLVALRTAEVYLEVLRRQELVALAKENLRAHQQTHEQISLRSERGLGRGADVDQTAGRLALANSNWVAEKSNLREAEINYFRVVDEFPRSLVKPVAPQDQVPPTMNAAVQQAIDGHPELKAAASDIEAARDQYKVAKAPYYPRLSVELGATANEDLDGVRGDNDDVSAMLRLNYNLYRGGKDKARRAETFHLIDEAKEVRNRTCRQVVESMRLSWNAFAALNDRLVHLKKHVDAAERARDAYRKQFNIGQRTLLDLLDSENEVVSAKSDYINGQYDETFAIYRVLAGKGQLLAALSVPLPAEAKPKTDDLTEIGCFYMAEAEPVAEPEPVIITRQAPPQVLEKISLSAGALFEFNKSELKPEGIRALDELAMRLKDDAAISQINVVGHTDSVGADEYNQKLSMRRANSVSDYLISKGITREMMLVAGMGESEPVETNETSEGRQLNRRVEIIIRGSRLVPAPASGGMPE